MANLQCTATIQDPASAQLQQREKAVAAGCAHLLAHLRPEALWVQVELIHVVRAWALVPCKPQQKATAC
jgi:hypothetical protein